MRYHQVSPILETAILTEYSMLSSYTNLCYLYLHLFQATVRTQACLGFSAGTPTQMLYVGQPSHQKRFALVMSFMSSSTLGTDFLLRHMFPAVHTLWLLLVVVALNILGTVVVLVQARNSI